MSEVISLRLIERQKSATIMPPAKEVNIQDIDDDEKNNESSIDFTGDSADMDIGYAQGQTFMIEYQSASGVISTRRISVFSILKRPDGALLLKARCHERKATRNFRVDRIRCCIDYDGEIFEDVTSFLEQTFGIDKKISIHKHPISKAERTAALRSIIGDQAVLFRAMAFADFHMHNSEIEICIQILANAIERAGVTCSPNDCQWLERYFRRIQPNEETIRAAINSIRQKPAREKNRFLNGLIEVMDADDIRHPSEFELLNLIAIDLTGVGIN